MSWERTRVWWRLVIEADAMDRAVGVAPWDEDYEAMFGDHLSLRRALRYHRWLQAISQADGCDVEESA